MYLVINHKSWMAIEQYRLFDTHEAAVTHAKSLGFESIFGFGLNLKTGIENRFSCGDVDVSIINLPTESEYNQYFADRKV